MIPGMMLQPNKRIWIRFQCNNGITRLYIRHTPFPDICTDVKPHLLTTRLRFRNRLTIIYDNVHYVINDTSIYMYHPFGVYKIEPHIDKYLC